MGKGSTKRTVQHFKKLPDGSIGCWTFGCDSPATRWIDMERYGIRRWLSTAYCDSHGDYELRDPSHPRRIRPIPTNHRDQSRGPDPD
ncbi:hypothetical protein [Nocardia sp. NPDC020380]|uniref:hypothetical protein n=1 Tax=Nocardia sp. NPDC020380 TaxID=3364309 RepID=UPI0037B0FD9F